MQAFYDGGGLARLERAALWGR